VSTIDLVLAEDTVYPTLRRADARGGRQGMLDDN